MSSIRPLISDTIERPSSVASSVSTFPMSAPVKTRWPPWQIRTICWAPCTRRRCFKLAIPAGVFRQPTTVSYWLSILSSKWKINQLCENDRRHLAETTETAKQIKSTHFDSWRHLIFVMVTKVVVLPTTCQRPLSVPVARRCDAMNVYSLSLIVSVSWGSVPVARRTKWKRIAVDSWCRQGSRVPSGVYPPRFNEKPRNWKQCFR